MKFKHPPSCLDAAYEREALMQGFSFKPVFPENRVCRKECKLGEDRNSCEGCGRTMDEITACGKQL